MKFTLLIYRSEGAAELAPANLEDTIGRHQRLQADLGPQLLATARLDDFTTAKTVRVDGERTPVLDGPYMESKEWLVGFYLVECDNQDEALADARQICTPDHAIEVRPTQWHKIP